MSVTIGSSQNQTPNFFTSITQVSKAFGIRKLKKYNFSKLNTNTQTNFRESFSLKLTAINDSVPTPVVNEIILQDFVNLFEVDVKKFHSEYLTKFENCLKTFENSFDLLLKKSLLQLRGGKKSPELKGKGKKVHNYYFARNQRLLPPAHFACLLEDLISSLIGREAPLQIRQGIAQTKGIEIHNYENPLSFWTAFYNNEADGKLPKYAKDIIDRKNVLKSNIRIFGKRLKNKKWALKLKRQRFTKQAKKPKKNWNKKVVPLKIKKPVVKKIEPITVATTGSIEVS